MFDWILHCVKSVKIRSFFWSIFSLNAGKYGPEKTPYFDTFYALLNTSLKVDSKDFLDFLSTDIC